MAFGGFQQQRQQGGQDITNTLVQTVKQDIEHWEKGHQWVFSCYSPAKEVACFPGIEDISPEEMRFDAYQAKLTGQIDAFQKKCQMLSNDYAAKRRALQNPSEQIKDVLRKIYQKENIAGINPASLFTAQPQQQQGIFGGGGGVGGGTAFQPASSIFGGGGAAQPQSSSVFGKPSSYGSSGGIFSSQSSSVFGGSAAGSAPASTSIFGQPAAPSTFSGAATGLSTGGFGQQPTFGQTPSITTSTAFGAPAAAPGTNVFSSAPQPTRSVFGSQAGPAQSVFGSTPSAFSGSAASPSSFSSFTGNAAAPSSIFSSPTTSTTTPFGTAATAPGANVFGSAPQATLSVFGSQAGPAQSVFGSTPSGFSGSAASSSAAPPLPFGAAPTPATPVAVGAPGGSGLFTSPQTGGSLFGQSGSQTTSVGLFGQVIKNQVDSSRHTPIDQLTAEEMAEFKAESFTLGKIPERPPPKEICV